MTATQIDKPYKQAMMFAVGRGIGEFVAGLVEGGMSREEAMELAVAYTNAMLYSQAPRHCHEGEDD